MASGKQTENRERININPKIIAYDVLDSTDDFFEGKFRRSVTKDKPPQALLL